MSNPSFADDASTGEGSFASPYKDSPIHDPAFIDVVDTNGDGAEEIPQEIVVHESIRSLLRPAAAEFLGSALFVFLACGTGMTTVGYQTVGNTTIGIALGFGMTIFVLAFMIGHISGGHLNFAVTFTFALLRKISILKCILYVSH